MDLSLPGVTSASMDLHKYGYAPKGVSILLHSTPQLRALHFFADASWPGYPLINNTLLSSRSVGPAAAAWAVLNLLGRQGLRDLACGPGRGRCGSPMRRPGFRVCAWSHRREATLVCVGDTGATEGPDVATRRRRGPRARLVAAGPAGAPRRAHEPAPHGGGGHRRRGPRSCWGCCGRPPRRPPAGAAPTSSPGLAAAAAGIDASALDDAAVDGLLQLAGFKGADGPVALPDEMAGINALLEASPRAAGGGASQGGFGGVFTPRR